MIESFMPDIYQKSIYYINYDKLYKKGIRCLLFDLDNTITPPHVKNWRLPYRQSPQRKIPTSALSESGRRVEV